MKVQSTIEPSRPFWASEVLRAENLPKEEASFCGIIDFIPWFHIVIPQQL